MAFKRFGPGDIPFAISSLQDLSVSLFLSSISFTSGRRCASFLVIVVFCSRATRWDPYSRSLRDIGESEEMGRETAS